MSPCFTRCQNCTTVAISHLSPDQMDYGEDDDETEEPPPAVSSEVDATAKKTATTGGEKDESGKKKEEVKTSENKTETHVQ